MSINLNSHVVVDNDKWWESLREDISEVIDLENGKSLVTITAADTDNESDISIPIAAATTAYARLFMSEYLADHKLDILYTDTDSIYTTTKLPEEKINNDLGGWKLENILLCCFLSP